MSSRDKQGMDNTYITTLSSQGGLRINSQADEDDDDDENGNTISEKDEDLEDLSCSQFIKQTEFSLNKEDLHSTSRFDSEYINNALHEGLNNSDNSIKENGSEEEENREEDEDDDENYYTNQESSGLNCDKNRDFRKHQRQFEDNYTPFSSFNRHIGMSSNQQFEGNSLNLSIFNQQQMQSQNEYLNELFQVKNSNYILEQENARLQEELKILKEQHSTNQDLIRMQAEYQQIKYDEKLQDALRIQRDKYEGKINNYKEQIKMYQTSIENIRTQYKDKNQKLYDIVLKLEKEKQELIDKNIDLIKTKIQNKLVEENNLNNSQSLYTSSKQNQLNNTLNLVNESFENLNFTGSFSQQLASMKQNQKVSLEKLQDLKIDSICIQHQNSDQQRMDSFTIQKQKDESFSQDYYQSNNNSMRIPHQFLNQSNNGSFCEINKDHRIINQKQSEQNMKTSSSNNPFQLTRLSKQMKQDEEANASFSQEMNNKFQFYDDEIYQEKIKKSLNQGDNLLKNNLSMNIGRKSEQHSPSSSMNHIPFQKNVYEKRSYSIDSNVLKDLNKSYNDSQNEQKYDSSLSRVKQYQGYLSNDNDILRKRNSLQVKPRKNSISDSTSLDTASIKYLANHKSLKNNLSKTQNTTINATNSTINSEKYKRKGSSSQRNTSFSQTHQAFNKENNQLIGNNNNNNSNNNKSSYMKQTQSSKQKKAIYKLPEHLIATQPIKINKSSSLEKQSKKKQNTITQAIPLSGINQNQQKKQFPIYSKVKNMNN